MRRRTVFGIGYLVLGILVSGLLQYFAGGLGAGLPPMIEFCLVVALWPLVLLLTILVISGGR